MTPIGAAGTLCACGPFLFCRRGRRRGGDVALTEKQKAFVQEYLVDLNATAAAKRAGYSEKNADKIGSELLGKTGVSKAIQKAMLDRQKRTEITQDRVLLEIGKVAFRDASDLPESALKYQNKLEALEMLAKHLGLFEKKPDTEDGGVTIVDDL